MFSYGWSGSSSPHLDTPTLHRCGAMVVGCYGGATKAGATKNEDGALLACAPDGSWELAMVLDGHHSVQSTDLVLATLRSELGTVERLLAQPCHVAISDLQRHLLGVLGSDTFHAQCRTVRGETACLIVARKEQFLWWLCIGDCLVYVFHPELAALGQYALNQRSFYEWIGQANTFALPVPCFASGVRELRQGRNVILLATDGLLEFGTRPFEDPKALAAMFSAGAGPSTIERAARAGLERVQMEQGRDSATIIAWEVNNPHLATQPSG